MAEQNAVAAQQGTQLSVAAQVKSMISQDAVKKKFTEVLGQKAPQFLASITNVVAGSAKLKKCPATTIMSAASVDCTYCCCKARLPRTPNYCQSANRRLLPQTPRS